MGIIKTSAAKFTLALNDIQLFEFQYDKKIDLKNIFIHKFLKKLCVRKKLHQLHLQTNAKPFGLFLYHYSILYETRRGE